MWNHHTLHADITEETRDYKACANLRGRTVHCLPKCIVSQETSEAKNKDKRILNDRNQP